LLAPVDLFRLDVRIICLLEPGETQAEMKSLYPNAHSFYDDRIAQSPSLSISRTSSTQFNPNIPNESLVVFSMLGKLKLLLVTPAFPPDRNDIYLLPVGTRLSDALSGFPLILFISNQTLAFTDSQHPSKKPFAETVRREYLLDQISSFVSGLPF
jgi:hypothetical protein